MIDQQIELEACRQLVKAGCYRDAFSRLMKLLDWIPDILNPDTVSQLNSFRKEVGALYAVVCEKVMPREYKPIILQSWPVKHLCLDSSSFKRNHTVGTLLTVEKDTFHKSDFLLHFKTHYTLKSEYLRTGKAGQEYLLIKCSKSNCGWNLELDLTQFPGVWEGGDGVNYIKSDKGKIKVGAASYSEQWPTGVEFFLPLPAVQAARLSGTLQLLELQIGKE